MVKYALIPKTQMDNPNYWVCHYLSSDPEEIRELEDDCYPASSIEISKRDTSGELLPGELKIKSCLTGRRKTFVIYRLKLNSRLSKYFNLN